MKIPKQLPQFNNEKAFIVVSAKEKGIVYVAHNGTLELIAEVEEHPETYSDKEGFFLQSGPNSVYGSGAPLEVNEEHNIKRFVHAIANELNTLISAQNPHVVYLFYPEYLKGYIEKIIKNPKRTPTCVIAYGNFLHLKPLSFLRHIQAVSDIKPDPADPASVPNGPNAEEKRKILEIGK
jgi:hypothetical protein